VFVFRIKAKANC